MEAVTATEKALAISIDVQHDGPAWTVTGPKSLASWVRQMKRDRPQTPVGLVARVAPAAAPPPASWLADPTGRHELRYWDGTRWTEYVSNRGATGHDPLS